MKPKNFPERKRQRQIKALEMRKQTSDKGNSNLPEILALQQAVSKGDRRIIRTKKNRVTSAAFAR